MRLNTIKSTQDIESHPRGGTSHSSRGRFGRQLKLGEVPIAAGLESGVGLVEVVVQRRLGVEDLLARPAVEARLLRNVQLHQVAAHVALPPTVKIWTNSGTSGLKLQVRQQGIITT